MHGKTHNSDQQHQRHRSRIKRAKSTGKAKSACGGKQWGYCAAVSSMVPTSRAFRTVHLAIPRPLTHVQTGGPDPGNKFRLHYLVHNI